MALVYVEPHVDAWVLEERVELLLLPDGGRGAVAGHNQRVVGQGPELVANAAQELAAVAALQVEAADAELEENVTAE